MAESPKSRRATAAPSLLADLFGVDLRSLALMRVALAVVVLADLAVRASDLGAFFTDAGVSPRTEVLESFAWLHAWPICIHLAGGALWTQALLFAIAAASAVALLVGYRTRWATFLVWFLTMSLQLRNLYIGHGSDAQLRLMLLWGCFLPLGARWSVDAAAQPSSAPAQGDRYLSVATVAAIGQLVIMYLSTGYAKSLQPGWHDGTALALSLNDEFWVTAPGLVLLRLPALCRLLTRGVLYLELAAPLLLFVPVALGPIRTATVLALIAMHVGFAVGLRVGIFPWVSVASVLLLLPRWFWDQVLPRWRTPERLGVTMAVRGDDPRCRRRLEIVRMFFLLPETAIGTEGGERRRTGAEPRWVVTDHTGRRHSGYDAAVVLCHASPLLWPLALLLARPPLRRWGESVYTRFAGYAAGDDTASAPPARAPATQPSWIRDIVCGVLFAYVIFWNIGVVQDPAYEAPPAVAWFGSALFLQQDWRMFARPAATTGWLVIPGKLKDGTEIDLFRDGGPLPSRETPVNWEKPDRVSGRGRNYRWIGFIDKMVHNKRGEQQLLYYGRYLCREWNRAHEGEKQLDTLEIYFMSRPVQATYAEYQLKDYEKVQLWAHWCFK